MVVLTLKNVCFLIKQWLIELCQNFSFYLVNLKLLGSKERILFSSTILNWILIAASSPNILFSGFDTTRFQIFFYF